MYRLSTRKSPALPSRPHLGAADQKCTGVLTYKTPPFALSWLSAVMAPVISTMSNFIKGGAFARRLWQQVSRDADKQLSSHEPSRRSEMLPLLLLPDSDPPVLFDEARCNPITCH